LEKLIPLSGATRFLESLKLPPKIVAFVLVIPSAELGGVIGKLKRRLIDAVIGVDWS
jgi:hypothetical protein